MSKEDIRREVYRALREGKAAAFPFPIEGRIPNFKGAAAAAEKVRRLPLYREASLLKINPDAPQWPLRTRALLDGKDLLLPTPRLRGPFLWIRRADVPAGKEREAASLRHASHYGRPLSVKELAQEKLPIGLVVAGSVAVTREGLRLGKGEGYSDLEYALLQELGYPNLPLLTTVHPLQLVPHIPHDPHDIPLDWIVTPQEVLPLEPRYPKPRGIDWEALSAEDLTAMPPLLDLRRLTWERRSVPDVIREGLRLLFVGINPGRHSAGEGHHFAGPQNYFWKLLHAAGCTPRLLSPQEDRSLLSWGIGITNLLARASSGEKDLSWAEMKAAREALRAKVTRYRPEGVVLLGKNVYRAYAGLPASHPVSWGPQPRETVWGVKEWVAPNPSPRSTLSWETRLQLFRKVCTLARNF
ncbi:MAG: 5-formyltetrahydrofolate cyclo-ligase [Bacillota bacterium]|nr:5-formyltetrahydrofolate cyclo-ligase [Bacillota bacterium]